MPTPDCPPTPCRVWRGSRTKHGYGRRTISDRCRGRRGQVLVHRWVMAQIHGWDAIEGLEVMHLCDTPACYRFDHLHLGTHDDNMSDMARKGRHPGAISRAKLSRSDVEQILFRYADGESQRHLGREFGVTRESINRIITGRTWRDA